MAAETPIRCSVIIDGRPSELGPPCHKILSMLEAHGFVQDDIFAVHLALEEAFLNAVKHGNKMDPTKKVTIDCTVDEDKIEICMTDEGEGFDPASVPDPRIGNNLFRPEGRGLLLINSYMHLVEYNDRGNRVRMVRYKGRPAPDPGGATA